MELLLIGGSERSPSSKRLSTPDPRRSGACLVLNTSVGVLFATSDVLFSSDPGLTICKPVAVAHTPNACTVFNYGCALNADRDPIIGAIGRCAVQPASIVPDPKRTA